MEERQRGFHRLKSKEGAFPLMIPAAVPGALTA